jgi:hypothetical protein
VPEHPLTAALCGDRKAAGSRAVHVVMLPLRHARLATQGILSQRAMMALYFVPGIASFRMPIYAAMV